MRARRLVLVVALAALLAAPLTPARATGEGDSADSRVGVVLMVVCGLALRATLAAPVPWAGIAAVTCLMGLVDAATSPDSP